MPNKLNWCDTGIVYETEAGGSGEGEQQEDKKVADGGEMSAEALKAELDKTRAALKLANKEAAERRKRIEEIDEAEKKRKEAEQTEVEKAQNRATKAESDLKAYQERARQAAIRGAVLLAATKADFINPEHAFKLADLSGVTVDENDSVTGVDEAIKALIKDNSHLVRQKTTSGGNPPGPKPAGGAGDAAKDEAAKITQWQWSRHNF